MDSRKVILGMAALALPLGVQAQQAAGELEEIVVTAQKRAQNLQEVPIAVSAMTENTIVDAGITNIQDLGQMVPTLTVSSAVGIGFTYLRGIGSTAIGPGIEYPVSVYLDGVYMASTTSTLFDFGNIERIEVLKGPQGTLFGRNATGGVISVVTREPTDEFRATGDVSFDNYETLKTRFYAGGRISDTIKADISVNAGKQGQGYGRNIVTGNDVYRNNHDYTIRSKWVFTPGDATKVVLAADYMNFEHSSNGQRLAPGTVASPGYGARRQGNYSFWDIIADVDPVFSNKSGGVSLRLDQEFAGFDFMSLSAYRDSKSTLFWDVDFTEVPWLIGDLIDSERQFSQELQLSSKPGGPLSWTTGLYYFRAVGEYEPTAIEGNLVRAIFGPTARRLEPFGTQVTESSAAFLQGTYAMTPATNLTLGARYTWERRSVSGETFLYAPTRISLGSAPYKQLNFEEPTYRIAVDHKFSDNVMGYASFNTGFKSGGFNTQSVTDPQFLPESVDAYEVGVKSELMDRRVRLNAAAFYYDYTNIQVQKVGTTNTGLTNGAAASIYGIDGDFEFAVSDALRLSGGAAWLKARFDEFQNAPIGVPQGGVANVPGDASGNDIPFSPELQATIGMDYAKKIPTGSEMHLLGNLQYSSGNYFEADNILKQPEFVRLNVAVRFDSEDGRSNVKFWMNNVTNEEIIAYSSTLGDGTRNVTPSPPRTYGVSFGFNF